MQTAATFAVGLLLLLAGPAAAQQPVPPDAAGVWGFAYEDQPGQPPGAVAERNVISCLAEPSLIAPAADGYVLNAYRIDLLSLMAGTAHYLLQFENLCSYDATSGLESCRRIADPADTLVYWTWYEPLDAAAGIYRAYFFSDEAELAAFKAKKTLPSLHFVTFRCPAGQQPRPQLLQQGTRDEKQSQASYDRMLGNFQTCGYPLCGTEVQRLHDLVSD
jgi:hypothetical protein